MITEEWAEQRIVNMYTAWRKQWCELLRQFGMRSIRELVGRSDLLVHLDYLDEDGRQRSTDNYQPSAAREPQQFCHIDGLVQDQKVKSACSVKRSTRSCVSR